VIATLVGDPEADGAIAATPITDTIKRVAGGDVQPDEGTRFTFGPSQGPNVNLVVEMTVDRDRLWAAQTPQVFRTGALREALRGDPERVAAATDEAMLVEAAGGRVLIHPAPAENLKVTTPLDLRFAEPLLAER
jgi:2-C-methyl-D-erythritol 4-phosphate cytidylyltransferase